MILVDVQILTLDEVYDFELDEQLKVGELTERMIHLVAKKCKLVRKMEEPLFLYAACQDIILDPNNTLRQQGIESGERLILL